MKRPYLLITGAAVAGLLIAAIGASAHTLTLNRVTGVHSATLTHEASGARTEPTDTPEAAPTSEPTEAPKAPSTSKPTEPSDTENESGDQDEQGDQNDDQQGTQTGQGTQTDTGDHGGGGD